MAGANGTTIIAVANQKGGGAKTTTAVNLTTLIAASGKRTLLVDMDPQGGCAVCLGMDTTTMDTQTMATTTNQGRICVQRVPSKENSTPNTVKAMRIMT